MEQRYDLKLADGRTVSWTGSSGEDAARRYVDGHHGATVVATRSAERHGLFVLGGGTIIG